jgi:acyl-CoA synthetase (NDP forming)
MKRDFSRLFRPNSVAVIGGGAWCRAVIEQLQKSNFDGDIWPVHPNREEVYGLKAYPTTHNLPAAPDAVFIGINRDATINAVDSLAKMGAGGAVCFASGFSETEDGQGG